MLRFEQDTKSQLEGAPIRKLAQDGDHVIMRKCDRIPRPPSWLTIDYSMGMFDGKGGELESKPNTVERNRARTERRQCEEQDRSPQGQVPFCLRVVGGYSPSTAPWGRSDVEGLGHRRPGEEGGKVGGGRGEGGLRPDERSVVRTASAGLRTGGGAADPSLSHP